MSSKHIIKVLWNRTIVAGVHMCTYQTDDAAVLVVVCIKEQKLQEAVRSALRWRDVLYDCWQDGIQTLS